MFVDIQLTTGPSLFCAASNFCCLGPILFLVYISDLDFGIRNWILKFADQTKILCRVNNITDKE